MNLNPNLPWQRNMVEKLIELLEMQKVLYDTNSKNYLDQVERYGALKAILDELKIYNPKITIDDIKKKIKSLRTQYMREIRRMERCGSDYKPVLWCFRKLGFLKEHSKSGDKRKKKTSKSKKHCTYKNELHSEEEISVKDESTDESLFVTEFFAEPLEETITENIEILHQTCVPSVSSSTQTQIGVNRITNKRANYEWLGLLVTSQMEEIPPEDQSEVAWEIQCVMRKHIEKSRLSNRS